MFEKIVFKNANEKDEFEKYIKLKGRDLYFQVYNILTENEGKISYYTLSSFIRYDKNLRDKLYIYMATLEEYLRAMLLERYDVTEQKKYESHCYNALNDTLIPRVSEQSKLYYGFQPDFGDLMHICETKGVYIINVSEQKIIKQLRNKTMHHALILFGASKNQNELTSNFNVIETQINAFYNALPNDYRSGFINDIVNLNGDRRKYLKKYYLEVQNGRICVKR